MSSIKEERNSCLRLQPCSVEVLAVSCWYLAKSNSFYVVRSALLLCLSFELLFFVWLGLSVPNPAYTCSIFVCGPLPILFCYSCWWELEIKENLFTFRYLLSQENSSKFATVMFSTMTPKRKIIVGGKKKRHLRRDSNPQSSANMSDVLTRHSDRRPTPYPLGHGGELVKAAKKGNYKGFPDNNTTTEGTVTKASDNLVIIARKLKWWVEKVEVCKIFFSSFTKRLH